MKTRNLLVVTTLACSLSATAMSASALPGMPSFGGAPAPTQVGSDPAAAQSAFFQKFTASRIEINAAQLELALAFGLKDKVGELQAEQDNLRSGPLDKDGYHKSKELSDGVDRELADRMAAGTVLSADGKTHYVASLPHLLRGTLLAAQLPAEAQAFASSAKSAVGSASFQDKMRFGGMAMTAVMIAKDMPGFVGTTVDTYKKTLTYGQANHIPVPHDATAALGSL